jgi:hypothetical protein
VVMSPFPVRYFRFPDKRNSIRSNGKNRGNRANNWENKRNIFSVEVGFGVGYLIGSADSERLFNLCT